jgi:hypothetical protein
MSRPRPVLVARVVLVALLGIQVVAFGAAPAAAADKGFTLDLASKGDYVAQTNFVQCVGASMQMMLNIIGPRDDRTARTQLRLQNMARDLSGPTREGFRRKGASVRGWAAGLNQLEAGPYRLVGTKTIDEALRLAASAIRETNRPVGLLVWRGRHAWVMSGFQATADPRRTSNFKVTAAIVMDPLYPHGSSVWGPSPKPREALSPKQLGRQFVPRRQGGNLPGGFSVGIGAATMAALSGKYVLVLPYEIIPTSRLFHVAR